MQLCHTQSYLNCVAHNLSQHNLSHTHTSHLRDIDVPFVWQAWHLVTSTLLLCGRSVRIAVIAESPDLLSAASLGRPAALFHVMQLCHTQLCHTQLFHTHTQLFHTHNFLTHTTLSHATLSHTTLSHNFLAHNSFTYNFLKLAILHHLLCLSCLLCFASITVSDYLEKLTCGFVRSFNFILQWSGTWEVPETCYDFCPGPWHCFRAPGEISGVPGHSCQRGAVISCHQTEFAPRGGHAIGRFGESARASAHFRDVAGT